MSSFREYFSEETDMQTMLFRYAVVVDVFNARLPDDLKCEQRLSDELRKKIMRLPYSEQSDRLLLLYGMGILDENTLKNLVLHNDADILSDIIRMEEILREKEGSDETDTLSYVELCKVLLLCANSKKYKEITAIDYDEAVSLISGSHIMLSDDGFIRCDRELTAFLSGMSEPFGFYDDENDCIRIEEAGYITQSVNSEKYDILSEETPIATHLKNLKYFLSVYDRIYGRDFIRYATEKKIPLDDNFTALYERYLNDIKLSFEIKAYPRRREICGDKVNYFDYAQNRVEDSKLAASEMLADESYNAAIRLDVDADYSEAELMEKAKRKYLSSHQLTESMVIEVIHGGKTSLYIYKDSKLCDVNNVEFRRQLFDFNKIWSIIQLCSREKKIRRNGDIITLPEEFMSEIAPEERIYAGNMVKEQYALMKARRQGNRLLQSLSDLKSAAKDNLEQINREKEEKAALKAEAMKARAGRKHGAASLNTDTNGGN